MYTQARAFNVGEDMGLQQKLVRHLRTSNIQITLLTILLWDPDRHNTCDFGLQDFIGPRI